MSRWRWRLRALPVAAALAGLAGGAALAADVESGRRKAESCAACHGADGNATTPGTPSLAGMPVFYTHWQLIMYRDGRRRDPQMAPFVGNLSDADMADLAAYYAAQRPRRRPSPTDPAKVATGRALADTHHCTGCHGRGLMGQQQVPLLAGQDLEYLLRRMRGYKAKTTSDLDGSMTAAAQALADQDVEALAHYSASLEPGAGAGPPGPGAR